MSEYRQDPPNSIQLEPTEGCNLRCSYCGIQGIREKGPIGELSGPYKFMTLATARLFGARLWEARGNDGWNPRLEFAMHGEPTMHPQLRQLVASVHMSNPDSPMMLTTNGIPLLKGFDFKVRELFRAGLDTIAIDDYRPHRVREAFEKFDSTKVEKWRYPEQDEGNPHVRHKGTKRLILVKDIASADEGNHAHISNHAGCGSPKSDEMAGKRCALPFRELSIRWDGNVALCCNDWRGVFKVGSIQDQSLTDIWHDPAMYAARKKLYRGERDFGPCDGCTHLSFRVGLLPDKKGKRDLPPADADDVALVEQACAGSTITPVVLRGYEK